MDETMVLTFNQGNARFAIPLSAVSGIVSSGTGDTVAETLRKMLHLPIQSLLAFTLGVDFLTEAKTAVLMRSNSVEFALLVEAPIRIEKLPCQEGGANAASFKIWRLTQSEEGTL